MTWDGEPGRGAQYYERIKAAWQSIGVVAPQANASWSYLLRLIKQGEFRVALLHFSGHSDEDLFHLFHSRGAMNLAQANDDELDAALADYRGARIARPGTPPRPGWPSGSGNCGWSRCCMHRRR
ncbi:MAG: hypothetical protein HC927_12750 [Deltaproteobacteria bacterium]|nr:hypothetical protein [Deltaproteobacteria bacterium]